MLKARNWTAYKPGSDQPHDAVRSPYQHFCRLDELLPRALPWAALECPLGAVGHDVPEDGESRTKTE